MPTSRGRKPAKRSTERRRSAPAVSEDQLLEGLFAQLLTSAKDLLSTSSPLELELAVSALCGLWWNATLMDADPEVVIGAGLARHAARRPSPHARLLLAGMAAVGSPPVRVAARRGLVRLGRQSGPAWSDRIGTAAADRAWLGTDRYGDQDVVLLECSYGGAWPHVVSTLVDSNVLGIAKDAFSGPPELVDHWRGIDPTMFELRPISLEEAAGRMLEAFERTTVVLDPPVSEDFAAGRALALARAGTVSRPLAAPEVEPTSCEQRADLVAAFLASRHAASLGTAPAVASCVSYLVDFGCDYDENRPLRVSPAKMERFLLSWLPGKTLLETDEMTAMPEVVRAWTRYAAEQTGLPDVGLTETLVAVAECAQEFPAAMADDTLAGPAKAMISEIRAAGIDVTDFDAVRSWLAGEVNQPALVR